MEQHSCVIFSPLLATGALLGLIARTTLSASTVAPPTLQPPRATAGFRAEQPDDSRLFRRDI
jgi:hypothetical protein